MSKLLQALGSRALPSVQDAIAGAGVQPPQEGTSTLFKVGGLAVLVAGVGYTLTRGTKPRRRSR